jgi:4-nitrophenyl phosphatase
MKIKGVIFDLDGTLYRGAEAVPGAVELVRDLHARGIAIRYATNRANRPGADVCAQLRDMGLACEPNDVVTSSDATAAYLKPGRVYAIGESGLLEALSRRGFVPDDQAPDYVIVSFDRTFDYRKLSVAARLIGRGAQFVATNTDRALRVADGIVPGTGSLVAAVEAATGMAPLVIGKPERPLFEMVLRDMGLEGADVIAVGDNLDTDIPAGHAAGMRTVLILTGISTRADLARAPIAPTWVVETFADLHALIDAPEIAAE